MSHQAMCWAIKQPGLFSDMKPSEQVVLYVLADCHNPVLGCYPGQDYIVKATNLSERSVRDQLNSLVERGLISYDKMRKEGRRETIRYHLGFEPDFRPANSAGQNGEVRPANFDSSTGKFRHDDRQILPDYKDEPVREPVTEPAREAREGEREEENSFGHAAGEDPKAIAQAFRRLTKNWPGFGGMPKDRAERAFLDLTPAERAEAERKHAGWLALLKSQRKSHTPGPESYFKNRLWQDVAEPEEAAAPQVVSAKPFGPDWSAARMVWLLRGPKGPAPTLTRIEQALIDKGEWSREELLADKLKTRGWPDVNAMHERAEARQPVSISAELAAVDGAMEPVPVGSARFEEWRRFHERQGWPWIPDPGALPVVWFPVGGPAALAAFEGAMGLARGG
ncbi:helix-turn-helix domain-containing protein [Aureimonas sp. D3]|uniref:helix-turn-helix domain-containing protein n=1 Tax=Aureimonas sp. D3 TaxID=1638164 RepID=UPI0012E362AD|nr:helix-turn-helix domain-containing protein [Aureimonas sp. D3]